MKNLKNKDILIGLIGLIILIIIAVGLIIRREFPQSQKEVEITDEAESEVVADKEEDPVIENSLTMELELESLKEEPASLETLSLDQYADTFDCYYSEPKYTEYKGEEMWQLEELFYYWDAYKLEAVADLVRLPRLRTAFTNELSGTNQFYYYGSFNSKGLPDGTGVAVYENNAYYCGEWKNGKRNGKGMWLQIYPDKTGVVNGVMGVVEHSYNGQWENDFPNGDGQEHFEYDLEQMKGEYVIQNVIGSFVNGYYHDELYIMTALEDGSYIDWEASAKKGVFDSLTDSYNSAKVPVWEKMEEEETVRSLFEAENVNWGISGLKKMN